MRTNQQLSVWMVLACVGTALGWAIRCQVPPSHVEVGMGEDCATCHQGDFQRATQPLHVGVLSQNCADCHSNTSWKPARGSNHSWPLEGAHAAAACTACHQGEPAVYTGTPGECVSCHAGQRDAVVMPSHTDFSDDCGSCHASDAWRPAAFEHSWPLEGAHASAACSSCHSGEPPLYDGTATDCVSCHQDDRGRVTQPSHEGFSSNCGTCHGNASWSPARFPNHEWPLEGAHADAACVNCHGDPPAYDGTPTTCSSCHQQELASVTDPSHAGFSDDCSSCHGTTAWSGAAFAHTSFPLTGVHRTSECSACHTGTPAQFAGTPSACVDCHRQDYDSSPFPGHTGFATTCQDCHTTSGWRPASGGNHPQNRFSITGRHNYPCNDCHNASLGPNGAGNTDCVGCHDGEHTLARMDAEHRGEVGNYPTGANRAPNFCLQCHADGNE
jgi:hypothetical protein